MQNIGKKIEIFVIVAIIAFIGIIYAFKQKTVPVAITNNPAVVDQSDSVQQVVPTTTIEYQGVDGKNALELLKASDRVDAKHYSFGDLVTGIDGMTPDSKHFWAIYVNGQFSQVGASTYMTKPTDTIKWEIDALVDTTK